MSTAQPIIVAADAGKRMFAASAAALQAILIDEEERILLLYNPSRNRGWQVVSGALEAGETILNGLLRETQEEIGPEVQVRPLGVVHAATFHYDDNVRYMLSIHYLLAYEGGKIEPGDDMAGSSYRWWHLNELSHGQVPFHLSTTHWILGRAISLYRLWRDERSFPLQEQID